MLELMNDTDFMGTFLRIILVVFGASAAFSLLVTFLSYLFSVSKANTTINRKEKTRELRRII